jgi:hypothetical protein
VRGTQRRLDRFRDGFGRRTAGQLASPGDSVLSAGFPALVMPSVGVRSPESRWRGRRPRYAPTFRLFGKRWGHRWSGRTPRRDRPHAGRLLQAPSHRVEARRFADGRHPIEGAPSYALANKDRVGGVTENGRAEERDQQRPSEHDLRMESQHASPDRRASGRRGRPRFAIEVALYHPRISGRQLCSRARTGPRRREARPPAAARAVRHVTTERPPPNRGAPGVAH